MELTKEILESSLKDYNINVIEVIYTPTGITAILYKYTAVIIPSRLILSLLKYENINDVEVLGGITPTVIIKCYTK